MREAFETYSIFKNVDNSILLLNDALKIFNFEFQRKSVRDLQDRFAGLFNYKKRSDKSELVQCQEESVKSNFIRVLLKSPLFLTQNTDSKEHFNFYFLKYLGPDDSALLNDTVHLGFKALAKSQQFSKVLVNKLRLTKHGNISLIGYIIISERSRRIFLSSLEYRPIITFSRTFSISSQDLPSIKKSLLSKYEINKLSDLAFQNFTDSYEIVDARLRFLMLITSLECLFNCGKDQIAHTISRHMALIVSTNPSSFQDNYTKIKKLYNLRNSYVHGSSIKRPQQQDLFDLEDYVRAALNYSLKSDLTKEELFCHLNKKGF